MTEREYGTICLNLGFMSGMFFAASGDMPAEFSAASNVIRAICERQILPEFPNIRRLSEMVKLTGKTAAPVPETQTETQEDPKHREEAEFKRSVCERLDAFRRENGLGSLKELAKIVNYRISQDNIVRIFNREPVAFLHYQHLNTALNKWEERKMKGDNTVCQSEN